MSRSREANKCPDFHLINLRRYELRRLLLARGIDKVKVANVVEDIIAIRRHWTAAALGRHVGLRFFEKTRLCIRTIQCMDRPPREVKRYFLERKRERDRRKAKEKRAMNRGQPMSPMAARVYAALNENWTRASALAGFADNGKRKRQRDSMRRMILRAIDELCDMGEAERKSEPGPRGGYLNFVRRNPAKPGIPHKRHARCADEIRSARRGDAKESAGLESGGQKAVASPKKSNKNSHNLNRDNGENRESRIDSFYYAATPPKAATLQRGDRAGTGSTLTGSTRGEAPAEAPAERATTSLSARPFTSPSSEVLSNFGLALSDDDARRYLDARRRLGDSPFQKFIIDALGRWEARHGPGTGETPEFSEHLRVITNRSRKLRDKFHEDAALRDLLQMLESGGQTQ
jgi:hypothetical protein